MKKIGVSFGEIRDIDANAQQSYEERKHTHVEASSTGDTGIAKSCRAFGFSGRENRNTEVDFTHRNAATAHSASGEVQAGGVQILGTAATCHNEIPTHTHSGIIRQPYSMNSGDDILRGNDAGKQTVRVQRIDANAPLQKQ